MNSESNDLMSIGRHCANPECNQIDFLPFPCQSCGKVYCLAHRVCPCSEQNKDTVLVCPLCARAVVCPPGEDVELVFDRHTRTDCDPSNYERVHKKKRCPAAGCKEKLTAINTYTCRDCGVTICLKHRLPADHACPGRAASAAAAHSRLQLPASLRRMFTGGGGGGSSSAAAGTAAQRQQQQQQRQQAAGGGAAAQGSGSRRTMGQRAAATATRTKDSVTSQLQQYRQRQRQQVAGAAAGGSGSADVVDLTGGPSPATAAGAGAGSEVCQQCGARFASVQQLIEHAEAAHAGAWRSGPIAMQQPAGGGGAGGLERCPHCGRQFGDPVALVSHVERDHPQVGGSAASCVLS